MMVIPPKWFYDMLFKRLKSRKNLLFNQIQAERAMEQIFGSPRNNTDRTDMEQVLVMAERRYMLLMGFKESVGESVGVIGEYYEMQNPTLESVIAYIKRAVRGHKTDKSDRALRHSSTCAMQAARATLHKASTGPPLTDQIRF